MIENIKPMDIEKRSFEIITELLGDTELDPENELVIKRVIHTTADFDYVQNLIFSEHAVEKGIEALKSGCDIVTDTQMAKAGINKTRMWRRKRKSGASPGPSSPWSGRQDYPSPVSLPSETPPPPWCPCMSRSRRETSTLR